MQGTGRQFFASARLTAYQDWRHATCHFGDALLHLSHGWGLAYHALQAGLGGRQSVWWCFCFSTRGWARTAFGCRPDVPYSGCNDQAKLLQIHRFGEVVECPGLEGFHRILRRTVRGDHDAALMPALFPNASQQRGTQPVGQTHVGDEYVENLFSQQLARFFHRSCGLNPVPLAQEGQFVQGSQVRLIIHDQDVCIGGQIFDAHGSRGILSDWREPSDSRRDGRKVMKNSLPSSSCPRTNRRERW